ncbi:MAG: hypothetical protein LBC53_07515 [Spirochaetaceae bacterium]|nr:hypothetical protein [Spirochaetaceae bacterium]
MVKNSLKRKIFVVLFIFLVSILYAENRTGKVVAVETVSVMGQIMKYVYLDSNNDNIIDALFLIAGAPDDIKSLILSGYIKNGISIVYNFDPSKIREGVFIASGIESVVSVDGISVTKMFSNH